MKSSCELCGLKIISINEGKQIGKIKDIIINSMEGSLAYFIVDQPSDYFGARIIAFNDIVGLGDYALTIPDSRVIQDVAHCPLAVELLKKDVKVIGAQVLTNKGCLVGEVTEVLFDESTGKIAYCKVKDSQEKQQEINCDFVMTYGKNIIIIDEESLTGSEPADKNRKITRQDVVNDKEILKKKIEEFGKNDCLLNSGGSKETIVFPEDFNVFEQRQLQFLLGKALAKDVELDNGALLKAGQVITADMLSSVKSRSTLMQLTAHVVK